MNQTALCIATVMFQVVVASRDGGYADVLSEEGHGGILRRGGVSVRCLLDATFAVNDFCTFTAAHGRFAAELLGGRGRSGHLSLIGLEDKHLPDAQQSELHPPHSPQTPPPRSDYTSIIIYDVIENPRVSPLPLSSLGYAGVSGQIP